LQAINHRRFIENLFLFLFLFMNIYIGNLGYNVREKDLERVLQEYGAVASVRIIKDRNTGKSKGFGFCEMENDEEARTAIEKLNGTEMSGRTLVVKEALPKS
jgi:RNA recognition motif-containing protein